MDHLLYCCIRFGFSSVIHWMRIKRLNWCFCSVTSSTSSFIIIHVIHEIKARNWKLKIQEKNNIMNETVSSVLEIDIGYYVGLWLIVDVVVVHLYTQLKWEKKKRKLFEETYSVFIDCYDVMMMAIITAFNKNCLLSIIWLAIPISYYLMAYGLQCSSILRCWMVQTNFRSLHFHFHPCDHRMWLLRDFYHNYWLRSDSLPIIFHYTLYYP